MNIKDAATVYAELKADAQAEEANGLKVRNYRRGGVWRTLLWLVARAAAALYSLIELAVNMAFLDYWEAEPQSSQTSSIVLDWIAGLLDVQRKTARKAQGTVTVGRNDASGSTTFPAGAVVATVQDDQGLTLRFVCDADVILAAGEAEKSVAVTAENVGSSYNTGGGLITVLESAIEGIDYVRNPEDWITVEGCDTETNGKLAARCRLKWQELSYGPGLYESLAQAVQGVESVTVVDNNPRSVGTVDVIIEGSAGSPSPALLAAVQAHIDSCKVGTDDVLVQGPTAKLLDLSVVATKHYQEGELSAFLAAVEAAMADLFQPSSADYAFHMGENYRRKKVTDAAAEIEHCVNFEVQTPSLAEIEIGSNELLQPGTVTVRVVTAGKR
ncbi:MAG: baseplate J/gp47 family protein [Candidatus Alcyoniella australis]|nr:baseplate J/gp47 family protein [Candidatus Alcyoniella australis]